MAREKQRKGKWDSGLIVRRIKVLYECGHDVSYNAMARKNQALVSAANYYIGSYRKAVEMAGLDYAEIQQKPRWTRRKVVAVLKAAKKRGEDLSWRVVSTNRHDELGQAAVAAVRPRLFGSWNAALQAAGLNPQAISRYRHWPREEVLQILKKRHRSGQPVNAGWAQKQVPGLYGACVRLFTSWDAALQAAKIKPETVHQRRDWTKAAVLVACKAFLKKHGVLTHTALRDHDAGLRRAIGMFFGPIAKARQAAGAPEPRRKKPRK